MKDMLRVIVLISIFLITGCSKINSSQSTQAVAQSHWGVVAFTNNTEVPQAGNKAMNISAGVLRSRGVTDLTLYNSNANCSQLVICPNATMPLQTALNWARHKHLHYVMVGAVNEWDYKVGLDGEPIVGLSMQLYDVASGHMIWSSVGSKIGNSRSGLTVIAQRLINDMLSSLSIR